MNRMFWAVTFLILASAGWAQSTWRGQAEVWPVASAPLEGYVAASNQFPRNSLLTVENYRTKKTIQVRVVSALPSGSSALVLLNAKAAQALDIKAGDVPLVGVRLDPTGVERADNPDPDVNPLALKPVDPAPEAEVTEAPAPAAPVATPTPSLEAPGALLPLPALAVTNEPEPTPSTPGKRVFATTKEAEPLVTEPEPEATPAPVAEIAVSPKAAEPTPATAIPPAPAAAPVPPTPAAPVPAVPVVPAPAPVAATSAAPSTVAVAPSVTAGPTVPVASPEGPPKAATPVAVKPAPASVWVSTPGRLEGPVLGQVAVLASLEKGRSYVQVGAWGSEADALKVLETVKSYVPLALFKAEGEKSPWRLVAASAPKAQLGVLVMHYRSQGYRTAAVVKG